MAHIAEPMLGIPGGQWQDGSWDSGGLPEGLSWQVRVSACSGHCLSVSPGQGWLLWPLGWECWVPQSVSKGEAPVLPQPGLTCVFSCRRCDPSCSAQGCRVFMRRFPHLQQPGDPFYREETGSERWGHEPEATQL